MSNQKKHLEEVSQKYPVKNKQKKVVENKVPNTVNQTPTSNPETLEESVASEAIQTKYKKLSGPKQTGQTANLDAVKEKEKTVEDARRRKRR